jgi:hypothetical protein
MCFRGIEPCSRPTDVPQAGIIWNPIRSWFRKKKLGRVHFGVELEFADFAKRIISEIWGFRLECLRFSFFLENDFETRLRAFSFFSNSLSKMMIIFYSSNTTSSPISDKVV